MNTGMQLTPTTDRTPIEALLQIGDDNTVSARDTHSFLTDNTKDFAEWARVNIEGNQFAEKGDDYTGSRVVREQKSPLTGDTVRREIPDYRLSIPFAKKLCMVSRTMRGEQAREYFIKVEDALKHVAQKLPAMTSNEMMLQILQNNIEQERKTKELEARQEAMEQRMIEADTKFDRAIQTLASPNLSWQDNIKMSIAQLTEGGDGWMYKRVLGRIYRELEAVESCDLANRVTRKKSRLKAQGVAYKQRVAVTKLDVVSDDKRLRATLEGIIKRYQAERISAMF